MLKAAITFPLRHWRGEGSGWLTLFGPLLALRLAVFLIGGLPILLDAPLLIWQIVGTWRLLLRHGQDLMLTLGGGAAMLVVLVLAALPQIDRLAARNAVPPPPWQPAETHVDLDGDRILLTGAIDFPMLDGLRDAARSGAKQLVLTSDGGRVHAARGLARLVGEYGLNTSVETQCASSCTLIFLAGRSRRLADGARLGFHGYGLPSPYPLLDPAEEERKDAAWMRSSGIAPEFIERIFAVPHDEIWFPTREELFRAGILATP